MCSSSRANASTASAASRSTDGAVTPCRRDLRGARARVHDDEAVDSLRGRSPGERLGVVSGGDPDHAACLLLRAQRGELVQHAARLERAGLLEELGLQPDLVTQRVRGERRRPVDTAADPLRRSEHVVAGHRHRRIVDSGSVDGHPIRLTVDDDLRRSRLTVFFRLLLAIPHFLWFVLWSIAAIFAAIAAWFAALVTGRAPRGLHNFLAAYVRYATHLDAYLALAANPYPGFTASRATRSTSRFPRPAAEPLEDRPAAAARDPGARAGGRGRLGPAVSRRRSSSEETTRRRSPTSGSEALSPPAPSSAGSQHSCSAGCRRAFATLPRTASATGLRPGRTSSSSPTAIRTATRTRSAPSGACRRTRSNSSSATTAGGRG